MIHTKHLTIISTWISLYLSKSAGNPSGTGWFLAILVLSWREEPKKLLVWLLSIIFTHIWGHLNGNEKEEGPLCMCLWKSVVVRGHLERMIWFKIWFSQFSPVGRLWSESSSIPPERSQHGTAPYCMRIQSLGILQLLLTSPPPSDVPRPKPIPRVLTLSEGWERTRARFWQKNISALLIKSEGIIEPKSNRRRGQVWTVQKWKRPLQELWIWKRESNNFQTCWTRRWDYRAFLSVDSASQIHKPVKLFMDRRNRLVV